MTRTLALAAALSAGLGLTTATAADMAGPARASFAPLAAPAGPAGFYFGTRNGFGGARDTRFDVGAGAVNVTNQYEMGFYNGLMIGYNFGPVLGGVGLRGELEFGRSQFSIKTHTVNGARVASIDSFGDLRSYGGFANAFLDFNLATLAGVPADSLLARITPYVGGGIGYSQVELRRMGVTATGVIMDDSDGRFAYNLAAGVGISIFERTTLEIGYRYLAVPDLQFVARDGTRTRTSAAANMVTLGMRRQF